MKRLYGVYCVGLPSIDIELDSVQYIQEEAFIVLC